MTKGIRLSTLENEHQRLVKELPKANAAFFGISNAQMQKAIDKAKERSLMGMFTPGYYQIWKQKKDIAEKMAKQCNANIGGGDE